MDKYEPTPLDKIPRDIIKAMSKMIEHTTNNNGDADGYVFYVSPDIAATGLKEFTGHKVLLERLATFRTAYFVKER